jgi:hypothetical protein
MASCFLSLALMRVALPCEGFRIIRGRASFHRCGRAVRMVVIPSVCSDWRDCTGSSTVSSAVRAVRAVLARQLRTTRGTRKFARSEPCIRRDWRDITRPLGVITLGPYERGLGRYEDRGESRTGVIRRGCCESLGDMGDWCRVRT